MIYGFLGILWLEFTLFKKKIIATTLGSLVSPVLYLIAFGWGLGNGMVVEGKNYLSFIIPGIVALTTMMVSFNNTANSINISRLYSKTFEEFMVAPISMYVYTAGKIVAGALYGVYSGLLIVVLVIITGNGEAVLSPFFLYIMILNCLVFSAGGFIVGLLIKSHGDMAKFSNFVITPMAFLCGTFFSINKIPEVVKIIIQLLPLTHTSLALRSDGSDIYQMLVHSGVLLFYFIVFFVAGAIFCKKTE